MSDPALIMADRCSPAGAAEAEPVVARVKDGRLMLVLDDGETLTMDAAQVGAVLRDAA